MYVCGACGLPITVSGRFLDGLWWEDGGVAWPEESGRVGLDNNGTSNRRYLKNGMLIKCGSYIWSLKYYVTAMCLKSGF